MQAGKKLCTGVAPPTMRIEWALPPENFSANYLQSVEFCSCNIGLWENSCSSS